MSCIDRRSGSKPPGWQGIPTRGGVTDEAYVSTKQQGAQAPSRVSCQDGRQIRTPDIESPPGERAKDTQRIAGQSARASLLPDIRAGDMSNLDETSGRPKLGTIRQRSDFLKAARGKRFSAPTLFLQARRRDESGHHGEIRIGLTCSRKLGSAVVRNRAKRRLRSAARAILPSRGRAGWDYVLVGRAGATAECRFSELANDLESALAGIHGMSSGDGPAGTGRK